MAEKTSSLSHADAATRKASPMCAGLLDYFPDALAAVAHVSKVGNDQHNPGQPLHWARGKSTDEADCIVRHLVDRGKSDVDGVRHSAKVAWRALALLQKEIEQAEGLGISRGSWENPIGAPESSEPFSGERPELCEFKDCPFLYTHDSCHRCK